MTEREQADDPAWRRSPSSGRNAPGANEPATARRARLASAPRTASLMYVAVSFIASIARRNAGISAAPRGVLSIIASSSMT